MHGASNPACVRLLLEAQALPHVPHARPLLGGVSDPQILRMLLQHPTADPNCPATLWRSYCAPAEESELLSPLAAAVFELKDPECVEVLLEAGADVWFRQGEKVGRRGERGGSGDGWAGVGDGRMG